MKLRNCCSPLGDAAVAVVAVNLPSDRTTVDVADRRLVSSNWRRCCCYAARPGRTPRTGVGSTPAPLCPPPPPRSKLIIACRWGTLEAGVLQWGLALMN